MMDDTGFPVVRAAELALCTPEQEWLIRDLWAASGVGLIGGHPKCCKSWLALEMAVSLASNTLCLGAFPPARQGRVLLYMAEDAQPVVRKRIEGLCTHRNLSLSSLDIFVITADTLRLDLPSHQRRLEETVSRLRPAMLLLDPLVRLHHIDENRAPEVSLLLSGLRTLQRTFDMAVVLVHHTRKNGATSQPGQALRGSSDLHAFGDTNLYLRKTGDTLALAIEHRAAPSPPTLTLQLVGDQVPHLEVVQHAPGPSQDLPHRVLSSLQASPAPLTRSALRQALRARNERLGAALASLERQRIIERTPQGWRPCSAPTPQTVPVPPYRVARERNDTRTLDDVAPRL